MMTPHWAIRETLSQGLLAAAFALGASACSGGENGRDGGITDDTALAFQGIYTLMSFTQNSDGCEEEGPSIMQSTEEHQILVGWLEADRTLWLTSCANPDGCRAKLGAYTRGTESFTGAYNYWLTDENSARVVRGTLVSSGALVNGACIDRYYSDLTLTQAADGIRFESRTKHLPDEPTEDEFCTAVEPAAWKAEAAGLACSSLLAMEAVRSDEL